METEQKYAEFSSKSRLQKYGFLYCEQNPKKKVKRVKNLDYYDIKNDCPVWCIVHRNKKKKKPFVSKGIKNKVVYVSQMLGSDLF